MIENEFIQKKKKTKNKKQTIPRTNYYRRRLRRYHWASGKYSNPSLQHSLEQTAGCISLHINADKTEYMCFNQKGDISILNAGSQKLMNNSITLEASISSTESDRLSIIWKSNLCDKIKRSFFQAAVVSIPLNGRTTSTLTKCIEKRLDGNCTRIIRDIRK